MYSSRRSGPVTDLHNAHTVSTLMRTMTTTSALSSHHPHRHSSRFRTSLNGTLPVRSSSIHQVENRDRDIERLQRALDSSRSADVLALEAKLKSNEKIIAHQSAQIDCLHETNRGLERRLLELSELKRDLSNKQFEERLKNDDLLRDLQDIDRLARKVQADKEYTVEAADRELTEAKIEIEHNHRELQTLDAKVASLTSEKKSLVDELETCKNQCAERDSEIARLQDLVERIQTDKAKLSRRVSKLVQNERELLQELQRCRRTTKAPTPTASGGTTSKKLSLSTRVEHHLKNVEDERDMYKNEVEILQKIHQDRSRAASPIIVNRNRGRSLSPTAAAGRSAIRRDTATSPVMNFNRRSASASSHSPTRCTVCGMNRNRSSPTKDFDDERPRRDRSKMKRTSRERDVDETQLGKVIRERDDLQSLLKKFERHMAEIQGNIKVLTNERDSLGVLYDQTKDELQRTRHDLLQNSQTPKVSLAAQSILRKVEKERDDAIITARAVTNERDSLVERLRIATNTGLNERARYEQRIEDLEIGLRKLDHDREEIIQQKHLLLEQIKQLENQIREQTFTIGQLKQELNDQKSTSTKLRYLSEEAEGLVEENQRQLAFKQDEVRSQEEKILRLEKKIHDLQEANQLTKDELHRARARIQTLDVDKDQLAHQLDLRAEENLHLGQELKSKSREIESSHLNVAEIETALDRAKEETKLKYKEISQLRIQIDRMQQDLDEYRRQLDLAGRDNKRLQDEIMNVSREKQKILQDLERAIDDKENLKVQVQEYIKQVSICENVISQKENDRAMLVEQYRQTSDHLSRAKITLAEMESQINELRQDSEIKAADARNAAERIDYLQNELHKHMSLGQEYEVQLGNINRSLQRDEDLIKNLKTEKQNLINEISNLRDLNAAIESKKEQIIRQLTSKDIENDQFQSMVADMKIEIDLLRTQLNNEKAVVQNLEELIGSMREKEVQTEIHIQERTSDLNLAKDRANLSDLKIQSQSKEIAALKTQVINLETDNKRLKSLLTSERYERERAAQDLRKLTDLTSHIDYESRYRSTSPRIAQSMSTSNAHRPIGQNYSPSRLDGSLISPTKGIDRSRSYCLDTTQ